MFSHRTDSCNQPRCMTCGSKTHNTDEHPPEIEPNCVNCKGSHPCTHKECNARRNRMGLKPIPTNKNREKSTKSNHKLKNKDNQAQHTPEENTNPNLDIGLTNDELSNIMRVDNSSRAMKENTARTIHTRAMRTLNSESAPTPPTQPSQGTPAQTNTSLTPNV